MLWRGPAERCFSDYAAMSPPIGIDKGVFFFKFQRIIAGWGLQSRGTLCSKSSQRTIDLTANSGSLPTHKVPIATTVQVGSPELNTHKTFDSAVSNAAGTTTMDVSQRLSPQIPLSHAVCEVSHNSTCDLVASQVPCDRHRSVTGYL